MRYNEAAIQQNTPKKEPKPREMPKAGRYSVENLTAQGVKKTQQEKNNG